MNYFILFANCIPVKGNNRSIICDLQRNQFWYIPNDLYKILIELKGNSISEIKQIYESKQDDIIQEYFDFLVANELGFIGNLFDLQSFPNISQEWDEPSIITNAIIDSSIHSKHDFKNIFFQLEELGCKHIQLRFYNNILFDNLDKILSLLAKSSVLSIDIIIPYSNPLDKLLNNLIQLHNRINQIIFFSSPCNKKENTNFTNIIYIREEINSHLYCGNVDKSLFSINIKNFTESLNFNSCLNRKISIDSLGNIKNCPSMQKSYGNIEETCLAEVLIKDEFKAVWKITKDQIEICKICEFRYICTDCRAFVENPLDINSKPLKCGYNPITCQWSEWSKNPLKQNGKDFYGIK